MKDRYETDLCVIGAGTSGALCAAAAAREGIRTVLVEKTGLVGGVGVTALMGSFANLMVNTDMQPLTGGIVLELIERMVRSGGIPYETPETAVYGTINAPFTIPYEPVCYMETLLEILEEAGVELLLNTVFCGVNPCEERSDKKELAVSACGRQFCIEAQVVVDATGSAQVAAACGVPLKEVISSHGCLMKLGNVCFDQTYQYIMNEKPWLSDETYEPWLRKHLKLGDTAPVKFGSYLLDPLRYDHAPKTCRADCFLTEKRLSYIRERWEKEHIAYTLELNLFRHFIRTAAINGDFLINKELGPFKGVTFNGDGIAYGAWGKGTVLCNVAKPYGFHSVDVKDETEAAVAAFRYNMMVYRFFKKYVPGFSDCHLSEMGSQTVSRSGQMIDGCDNMEPEKDKALYHQAIYLFGGIYEFQKGIQVPFGKIIPKNCENLFVIGKGSSNGGKYRSQISCMSMGVAAAAAAKVIIDKQCTSYSMEQNDLERQLLKMGVKLRENADA